MEATPPEPTPPPRKRRWFQVRLSTCIVMMFAAGVMMYINVQPQGEIWVSETRDIGGDAKWERSEIGWHLGLNPNDTEANSTWLRNRQFGWPSIGLLVRDVIKNENNEWKKVDHIYSAMDIPGLIVNLACALAIILAAAAAELLARRFAKQNQ